MTLTSFRDRIVWLKRISSNSAGTVSSVVVHRILRPFLSRSNDSRSRLTRSRRPRSSLLRRFLGSSLRSSLLRRLPRSSLWDSLLRRRLRSFLPWLRSLLPRRRSRLLRRLWDTFLRCRLRSRLRSFAWDLRSLIMDVKADDKHHLAVLRSKRSQNGIPILRILKSLRLYPAGLKIVSGAQAPMSYSVSPLDFYVCKTIKQPSSTDGVSPIFLCNEDRSTFGTRFSCQESGISETTLDKEAIVLVDKLL